MRAGTRHWRPAARRRPAGRSRVPSREDSLFKLRIVEAAFDRNPDGLVIVSATGEIRAVNEAMVVLSGWPEHELLHEHVEVLLPPAVRERHAEHRAGYVRDPRTRAMGGGLLDLEMLHRSGELVPVQINLAPLLADAIYTLATVRRRGPV